MSLLGTMPRPGFPVSERGDVMVGFRELYGCVLLTFCGLGVGSLAAVRFGWPGAILGFAVGFVGAFLLIWALVWTICFLEQSGAYLPLCHGGTCRGGRKPMDKADYEWARKQGVDYRCKCGHEYVMKGGGRRFLQRLPDGTLKPYMVHRPFRGWFPDADADCRPTTADEGGETDGQEGSEAGPAAHSR